MFQSVGGMRSISSDRRTRALPMECALRLAFGHEITKKSSGNGGNGALRFAARPDFGRRLYRALTGGSKCDYIQPLARLPPPSRLPGSAVGNEAAGQHPAASPVLGPLYGWCSVVAARVKLQRPRLSAHKGCASSATDMA